jgi:hypothetical protein
MIFRYAQAHILVRSSAVMARRWLVSRLRDRERTITSKSLHFVLAQQRSDRSTKAMKVNGLRVKLVNPWKRFGTAV